MNTINTSFNQAFKDHNFLKWAFWSSLIIMLCTLWIIGFDSGFNSDEMDMNAYGKANIEYYKSGGKDTSYLHPSLNDGTTMAASLKYYGSGFEYFATGISSLFGDSYEYIIRHMLNQFLAIIGILFSGLICKRLFDYRAGILCIWLLFLTPILNGLAVFDTKDIPFMTAYIAVAYFMVRFFDYCEKLDWISIVGLFLSITFLLSLRVGGIIITPILLLYIIALYLKNTKVKVHLSKWSIRLVGIILLSLLTVIVSWPFVLENPMAHLIESINVNKNFPQVIPVIFEGSSYDSLTLPKNYLIKIIAITLPVIIQTVILLGFVSIIINRKKLNNIYSTLMILGISIFPIIYTIQSNTPLYNSWRHLIFTYPGLVIIGSIGTVLIIDTLKIPALKYASYGVIALGMLAPTIWIFKNAPLQYIYFNQFAGGLKKSYLEYDTDYWQISSKQAIDWFMKNEYPKETKDTLVIATNAFSVCNYIFKKRYPDAKVTCQRLGFKSIFAAKGTYTIYTNLFLEPYYLENCFPSPYTIHTISIDDVPMAAITKDTNQYLYNGHLKFSENNHIDGDYYFSKYLEEIKYNNKLNKNLTQYMGMIALTKLGADKLDEAFELANQSIKAFPAEPITNLTLGIYYLNKNDKNNALQHLNVAYNNDKTRTMAEYYLKLIR
jgi:hypothetical protein